MPRLLAAGCAAAVSLRKPRSLNIKLRILTTKITKLTKKCSKASWSSFQYNKYLCESFVRFVCFVFVFEKIAYFFSANSRLRSFVLCRALRLCGFIP